MRINLPGTRTPRSSTRVLLVLLAAQFTIAIQAPSAPAAATARPEALIQFPADRVAGSGAGRIGFPRGIAASPVSGDLYIVDESNKRIDEFSAWGRFVRAFGWDVVQSGPDDKGTGLEVCQEEEDVCRVGSTGSGAGQLGSFGQGGGIAVDVAGDVYATDMRVGHRVQKFSATGEFLLMFGGEVDHTTDADVCTRDDIEVAGDSCGAGVEGTGNSQFRAGGEGRSLAVSHDGSTVYVGDRERVQEFGADGVFKGQITFKALHEELASFPEATEALGLAVDPVSGDLYLIVGPGGLEGFSLVDKRVFRIDPESGKLAGPPLSAPTLGAPTALATDSAGDVYVVDEGVAAGKASILEFDAVGNKLIPSSAEEEAAQKERDAEAKGETVESFERFFGQPPAEGLTIGDRAELLAIATDSACKSEGDDLYAAYIRQNTSPELAYVSAFGGPPQDVVKCPPPPARSPEIGVQYATYVGTDSAVLGAEINPHYGTDTRYYLQYGEGRCSEGGCGEREPLVSGALLSSKVSNALLKSGPVFLAGLDAGQTYHYRFVAENSVGLVRGVGGEVGVDGREGSFTTFGTALPVAEDCGNSLFREGFSVRLSDCRAYELVSPPDRRPAGDVVSKVNVYEYPAELNQSSIDGERLAYSSEFAFGDAAGAPYTNEYIATRHAGEAWSTHAISPPRESKSINKNAQIKVDIEEKAFTADLCSDWLMHDTEPVLSANAIAGFPNIYRRQNCDPGADSYDAITMVKPTESTRASGYWPELQGVSADGSRAVFRAGAVLGEGAPDLSDPVRHVYLDSQLYEASEGMLRFVCVLPNGSPYGGSCSAGTPRGGEGEGRTNRVEHALSGDGRRVYWSGGLDSKLFLRENADRAQSAMTGGKCLEAEEKACSYKVSNEAAQFWTAAEDGSLALYTEVEGARYGEGRAGKLREFDAATKKSKTIVEDGVIGVAGASLDLSRFYFVSTNEIGGEGMDGRPNLYLSEDGAISLVASLTREDADVSNPAFISALNSVSPLPMQQGARTSGDGRHLIFASLASLTGYDNHDAITGRTDDEIYLYDVGASGPVCISCNPSGARPMGGQLALTSAAGTQGAAAVIPVAENELYAPRVMTEDGGRVFFDSFEGLVARDTNGKEDVYEWERASGQETCEELGAELYVASSGGCLSLISSGESAQDSTFLDMSIANGARDVFFKTGASLVGQDPGLIDIYDAREGGGLPGQSSPPPVCEGEACQGASEAPVDSSPASSVFSGPTDLVSALAGKTTVKRKTAAQLRAQQLASALRACRKITRRHGGVERRRCEARARKKYGRSANTKSRANKSNSGGHR
jgi:DNA-binding beta-propeller fold protein YncE